MVQEYERAVIFRLGRIKKGGAQGPGELEIRQKDVEPSPMRSHLQHLLGLFFIIPCIDQCVVVDLRWRLFFASYGSSLKITLQDGFFRRPAPGDFDQRQRHCCC